MTDEAKQQRSATVPGAILGLALLLAALGGFVYLCDWLIQPNTPEQLCAEVVAGAFGGPEAAPISIDGSARVEATSIGGDVVSGMARQEMFEACLARYASAPYRSRQGWWR